ncbi:translation initiation factor 3 subunit CLU1 ASCRUDRAFT_27431, partial [Ascoidea rubescens DSM 1968]
SSLSLVAVEKPYTERDVREHLLKLREISALTQVSEFETLSDILGIGAGSSKFQNIKLSPIIKKDSEDAEDAKKTKDNNDKKEEEKTLSPEDKEKLASYSKELFIAPTFKQHSPSSSIRLKPALKNIFLSSWNPPSSYFKLRGHLLYLTIQTLENETYHVTSSINGFFVNNCSSNNFDPTIKKTSVKKNSLIKSHSLISLVRSISLKFNQVCKRNNDLLNSSSPLLFLLPTDSFLSTPWIAPSSSTTSDKFLEKQSSLYPDLGKTQLQYLIGGSDGADLYRDWNEEYQSVKELPKSNLQERIFRERLLSKIGFEFTLSATKGAIEILNGNISPMNPNEDPSQHIFLRNNIFYSLATDSSDLYVNKGGNEASRYCAIKDLDSVRVLNKLDDPKVSHLCTAIIDFCGRRVVCQTPVPGVFNNDTLLSPEEKTAFSKIVYGSSDEGITVSSNEKFEELFTPIAEAFHLRKHSVYVNDGADKVKPVPIVTSFETKGMKGTDYRNYIIDLYKTSPLDIEFIESNWKPDNKESFPHKETYVRHECVEEWFRRKVAALIKEEAEIFEKKKAEKDLLEDNEKPTITLDPSKISINPDCFSLTVDESKLGEKEKEELHQDQQIVREISQFISKYLIPEFLEEIGTSEVMAPIDGEHLTSLLHKKGINLRYIGAIANSAIVYKEKETKKIEEKKDQIKKEIEDAKAAKAAKAKKEAEEKEKSNSNDKNEEPKEEAKEETKGTEEKSKAPKSNVYFTTASYEALYKTCIQEMIARSVKHILRELTTNIPIAIIPSIVTLFLNCFLGYNVNSKPKFEIDEELKSLYSSTVDFESFDFLAPNAVFELIEKEVYRRFRFNLSEIDKWYEDQKVIKVRSLFREISLKFGIQWASFNYPFTVQEFEKLTEEELIIFTNEEQATVKKGKKKGKKSTVSASASASSEIIKRTTTFIPDDIVTFVPIIKDSVYKPSLVEEIWDTGRAKIYGVNTTKEDHDMGISLLLESLSLYEQIYGTVHPELAKVYGLIAQSYFDLGNSALAVEYSRKGIFIAERTLGIDFHETFLALINLAYYEHINGNTINSLAVYSRILKDWNIIYGDETHPASITTLTNIALMYQSVQLYDTAKTLLSKALELSEKINGKDSTMTGMIKYQFALSLTTVNNINSSVKYMNEAYKTFRDLLGENDPTTIDAKKNVDSFTRFLVLNTKQERELRKIMEETERQKETEKATRLKIENLTKKINSSAKNDKTDSKIDNRSIGQLLKFIEGEGVKSGGKRTSKK